MIKNLDRKPFYIILFPTVVEVIFNQMFAMVDNIMIGHIPDSTVAVAALSLCQPIINLVVCVMTSFFIGTTAVISGVDWVQVGSMSLLAGILSLLTSVATGLPEV